MFLQFFFPLLLLFLEHLHLIELFVLIHIECFPFFSLNLVDLGYSLSYVEPFMLIEDNLTESDIAFVFELVLAALKDLAVQVL